jgi:hypothetical protein
MQTDSPFDPPLAASAAPEVPIPPRLAPKQVGAVWLAVLAPIAGTAVAFGAMDLTRSAALSASPLALATLVGGWGVIRAMRLARLDAPLALRIATILAIPAGAVLSFYGAFMALWATAGFTRGRQLRRFGAPELADLTASARGWTGAAANDDAPALDAEASATLAEAWRTNARTEHASVAAFARVATELMALGAPRRLVEGAHRDALDEIAHTEACFALATRVDGRALGPGALPIATERFAWRGWRRGALARLAVDSLVEGVLLEGVSARAVAELARVATWAPARATLTTIARDEARHATHAFEVLTWCLEVGGAPVEAAVRGALHHLPDTLGHSLTAAAADGALEPFGIPSRAREEACYAVQLRRTRARVARLLEGGVLARAA